MKTSRARHPLVLPLAALLLLSLAACQDGRDDPLPAPEEATVSSNVATVEAFVDAFNRKDVDAVMSFFTDDPTYHNLPTDPVTGKEAVRTVIESFVPTAETIDWEMTHISESGDTVLTERVDRFVFGGREVVLPVMGAFDMEDGKIAAWRDYWDQATWDRQMAQ